MCIRDSRFPDRSRTGALPTNVARERRRTPTEVAQVRRQPPRLKSALITRLTASEPDVRTMGGRRGDVHARESPG
eukprot:1646091-Alexandrium_andersonii.AAC.1